MWVTVERVTVGEEIGNVWKDVRVLTVKRIKRLRSKCSGEQRRWSLFHKVTLLGEIAVNSELPSYIDSTEQMRLI